MAVNLKIRKAGAITAPAFLLAACENPPPGELQHFIWFIGHPEIFIPLAVIIFGPLFYLGVKKFGRPRGIMAHWALGAAFLTAAAVITGASLKSQTGVFGAADTYFLKAHYRYAATVIAFFAVFPLVLILLKTGLRRPYSLRLARVHFWLTFIGFNALLLPQFFIAFRGMPRRYVDYKDTFNWANAISVTGAVIILLSLALFAALIIEAIIRKRPLPDKSDTPIARTFD